MRKFVAALDQAERDAHANPADVVAFAQRRFQDVPSDVAAAAARRMLEANAFPRTAQVSVNGWQQAIALRVKNGDLRNGAAAARLVDNEFLPH